jgi:hypothetical protein
MVDAYESGLRQLGKTHGDPGAVTFAKAIVMAATQAERDPVASWSARSRSIQACRPTSHKCGGC